MHLYYCITRSLNYVVCCNCRIVQLPYLFEYKYFVWTTDVDSGNVAVDGIDDDDDDIVIRWNITVSLTKL